MPVLKTNINGNPNIGLYGYCTDEFCLLGTDVPDSLAEEFGKTLGVPVHKLTIAGTSLLGVFLAGNSKKLLVPGICFDYELKKLEELNIDYTVIKSKITCLGNTILCNDHGALVSEEFSADTKKIIRQALGTDLKPGKISGLDTVGSLGAVNGSACIISRDASEAEMTKISDLLKVPCFESSVNMGSPFISSGVLCNDHGLIIGDLSGGPEIVHIEESLGLLDRKDKD